MLNIKQRVCLLAGVNIVYSVETIDINIDTSLTAGWYVNVATIMDMTRLSCKQIQVNGGAAVFLDKKHYNVYIFQPISVSLRRFF